VISLDPGTVLFMTTLMSGAMSIVMYSLHHSFGGEVQGLGRWAHGLLALVGAAILFMLRGTLPPPLALMAANLLLFWGIGLSMIGTQEFFGQPPSWRTFHAIWIAGFVAIGWWLLAVPHFSARVAAFSFLVVYFYAVQVVLAWRHGTRHFSTYFFAALMTIQILVVLGRGVAALLSGARTVDLMRDSALANLYLAVANFMVLMLTVAFMTMATRRLQTILERRSTHDPLTGVLNRRGFAVLYERVRVQLRRSERPLTLMSIDLDFFKTVNDRHGHMMGDRVLVHVARVISQSLRESDDVARFGGEEFVVLLPEAELPSALQVAERIRAALRTCPDHALPVCTVSIGIGTQRSGRETLDSLLARTDAALYRAKQLGRDRVEVAGDGPVPGLTAPAPPCATGSGTPY
jgi:diguanylate cyclase (GGDEF)-like protein